MELVNIPREFSSRYVNDGFSGGEKKRMEVLQLAMLRPKIAVLDETDSGLDIDALRVVAEGVNKFAGPEMGVLIITHYQRILHLVEPDFVHVMYDGRIVKEGGPELVGELEAQGLRLDPRGGRGGGMTETAEATFPIERVRASFPALEREVNGQPVAYLDSGASSQRVLASIQAVDRYERRHHSNVHRGSHTLSAEATAAYEGARATVADHIGAADRREVRLRPQRDRGDQPRRPCLGRANVGAGDRIVLTEMEHHSNIVPWQLLAERTGAEIDWVPVTTTGCSTSTPTRRCSSAGRSWSRSPTSRTCSEPRTRSPRSRGSPTKPARWCSPTAPRRRRSCRSTWPTLGVDFYALTGHKAYGADRDRRALGAARAAARDAAVPRRRLDDPQGDHERAPPGPTRRRGSRPARRRSRRRSGWRRRFRWLDGLGMDAVAAHEREIADYALERLAEVPGLRVFGPPPSPERLGPVSFELEGVHAHDVSEILDRHGVAVRAGHHCAQPLMERLGVAATARASFGVYTTPAEIDRLVEGLLDARRVFGLG